MNIKDIFKEELSIENLQKNLLQLNNGIIAFGKKVNTNPALAQSLGKDIVGIGKISSDIQKQFQEFNKQKQLEAQKKQQQEIQKQQEQAKAVMANGMNNLTTTANATVPKMANDAN